MTAGVHEAIVILEILIALFAIFIFLLRDIGKGYQDLVELLGAIIAPKVLPNFREMVFYGFIAAFVGGFVWNFLFSGTLGGPGAEPHGIYAFLWAVITNSPTIIFFIYLNKKFGFTKKYLQLIIYLFFLIGIGIGALLFYDIPIGGKIGFREYFMMQAISPLLMEMYLVLIWSSLISFFGFFFVNCARKAFSPVKQKFIIILRHFLEQFFLTIFVTSIPVAFFLITFPYIETYHPARGIIAGLFLRLALFFELFKDHELDILYLFCWDNVPGDDSERLLRYLRDDHNISWAESAEIHKSDDGKTIRIFKDKNSVEVIVDEKEEKATLKIRDDKLYDLRVKKEKGELCIYGFSITFNKGFKDVDRNEDEVN